MGFSILIVDDVEAEARELASLLDRAPAAAGVKVDMLFSAASLESHLRDNPTPDVLFLDISLGEENGVELTRRLGLAASTQVVYVSGFDEFLTRTYDTPHASFIKKPFCQENVSLALEQALRRARSVGQVPLVLRHDHVTDIVRPEDILYAESDRRNVVVHTNSAEHRTYAKLSDILGQLPDNFVRCHQSYVVNLDYVARLGAETVTLSSGKSIPVSRRWRPSVREALFGRIREGC